MIILKPLTPEDWPIWREMRLKALTEAPHAFGATLAEWQGPGDSERRWRARLENVAFNAIATLFDQPSGMIGATEPDVSSQVELRSLWVAPWARGLGVGDALVTAVSSWAAERQAGSVILRVYEDNEPAIALYRRNGFAETGAVETSPTNHRREMVMARFLGTSSGHRGAV